MFGICLNEKHNEFRGDKIGEETFEYKGCWNCIWFSQGNDFPYYDVEETSRLLCGVFKG